MHDYKSQMIEEEINIQSNSDTSWIYIGTDINRPETFKIGLTKNKLQSRNYSSQNPFYTILYAFKAKHNVDKRRLAIIEKSLLDAAEKIYPRIPHHNSNTKSEWFEGNAIDSFDFVNNFLYEKYSYDMYCYYDFDREQGLFYGWLNNQLISNSANFPFQPGFMIAPYMDAKCCNPGGCGDPECECSRIWD